MPSPVLPPPARPPEDPILVETLAQLGGCIPTLVGMVHAHKPFTCMAGPEGEVPFLSPGLANMQLPVTSSGPLLRPLLRWSQRGQGRGGWPGCGAANGLA